VTAQRVDIERELPDGKRETIARLPARRDRRGPVTDGLGASARTRWSAAT
jgi:hypothetical protein